MALTIDELNIQIAAESTKATKAIDTLIGRLETLQSKLGILGASGKSAGNGLKNTEKGATKAASGVNKYSNETDKASKSTKSFTDKLVGQISKFHTLYGAFKSAAQTMSSWFNESNEYVETLNLFNVTMGDGADAAYEYAESVQKLVGIDIKEWMQYQGVFKNLTAGFGVASKEADIMSQNLTQLSYDMASFFNTDVETAFDKLSSAMSGQVKGLREFGIDTTVASLQEYALAKGIDTKVRSMTQAEKSLLRYNYIMEKSIMMQGDMARTLVTPANALRILNAQLTQMKRALGNIISVVVVQFIPYIQALVEVITDAANAIANFFGYELPDIDYSGLGGGLSDNFEDGADSLDDVSDSLKKIKKQLMGFDELNIISNPDTGSIGSGGGGIGSSGGLNMEPLEYDFLKNLDLSGLDKVKKKLNDIWKIVKPLATAFAGMFAVGAIMKWVSAIGVGIAAITAALYSTNIGFAFLAWAGGAATFTEAIAYLSMTMSVLQKVVLGIAAVIAEFLVIFFMVKDLTVDVTNKTATLGQCLTTGIAVVGAFTAAWIALSAVFNSTAIGALVSALVLLLATVAGFISGLGEAGKQAYESSEDFKIMQASIETTQGVIDSCAASISNMEAATKKLDETSLNFALAKSLTTEIFDLNEKAQLSQYELAQIKQKVEVLNGLNIDGLHLAIDETTGRVVQTRQETEKLIETLEREARLEAMRDILVEAYKAQYQAIQDNNTAYKEYNMASDVVNETEKKLADTVWYEFKKRGELKAQLEKQREALKSADKAFNDSREVNLKATETIEKVSKEYINLATNQDKVTESTKNVADAIGTAAKGANTNAANVVAGAAKGITTNAKSYTNAVKGMANDGNNEFANAIDSHSPAKKYIGYAANIISGLVKGLKDNKQSVLDSMSSLAKDMGKAFEKAFTLKNISLSVYFSTKVSSDKKKVYEALGLSGWPNLNWYTYATGGFPNVGEMFIAREAGPELVGSIGRKTAVANNDQIVSGIESGVYRAMVAANANNNSGGTQTIRIINEIDGDVVGEKVIQYHNGKVIQTGVSPLLV